MENNILKYIDNKKNELYDIIKDNNKNIIKYVTPKIKKFKKYYPTKTLLPKIILIDLDVKMFKKKIILETLLLIKKENNMMPILNYKLNYIINDNKIISTLYHNEKNSVLYLSKEITEEIKEINIEIKNNNEIENTFIKKQRNVGSRSIEDTLNIGDVHSVNEQQNIIPVSNTTNVSIIKDNFIRATIIITSTTNIYYWMNEIDDHRQQEYYSNKLKIYYIYLKNKINEYNINEDYDIIIIRCDLFKEFIEKYYKKNIIYNRIIIDYIVNDKDNTTGTLLYWKNFSYCNSLEIIIINRNNVYNGINKILENKAISNNINNNNLELLLKNNINNLIYKLNENKPLYIENNIEKKIKINIIYSIDDRIGEIFFIQKLIKYYTNYKLSKKIIIELLDDSIYIDNNDNIILKILYELNNINQDYKNVYNKLKNKKNEMLNELYILIKNKESEIPTLLLSINKLNSKYNIKNDINNKYFLSKIIYNNIKDFINNITKEIIQKPKNKKDYINLINETINNYYYINNIIDKYLINIEINKNKLENILNIYKNKIKKNILKNECLLCEKEVIKPLIYKCCYNICCEKCHVKSFIKNKYINCTICNKELSYNEIIQSYEYEICNKLYNNEYNNEIEHIFKNNKEEELNKKIEEKYINETILNKYDVIIQLIENIKMKNKEINKSDKGQYKIIIYTTTIKDLMSELLKDNIITNILEGTYYQKKNILNKLENNNNIILIDDINNMKMSLNYDYITDIIIDQLTKKKEININLKLIERFFKSYKENTKNIYYII